MTLVIRSAVETFVKVLLALKFKCTSIRNSIVILLIFFVYTDYIGDSIIPLCNANPMPTSLVLPPSSSSALRLTASSDNDAERMSLERVASAIQTNRVVNLTRLHSGDVFNAFGKLCSHHKIQMKKKLQKYIEEKRTIA